MGSQRLRHNWATFISLHFKPCNMHPKDFTICPLSALPTSARKASPWLYPWRLSSTTVFFMKPPHPNTHIHSSAFKVLCLYLTLLIKMFHFSSRTGNILSIPSTEPNKILRNPFVYWISENTSFLIFRLYTLQLHRPSTPGVLLWQFSGPPTYHTKCFSGLLLTTEINYLEWFWLCIPGSYQKDYFFRRCLRTIFLGDVSALFILLFHRSLQLWGILNTSQPEIVKSTRTWVRSTMNLKFFLKSLSSLLWILFLTHLHQIKESSWHVIGDYLMMFLIKLFKHTLF